MGRPAKNGVYDFRIRAQKCNSTCKKYEYCTIRLDPLGKCAKRDKKEYYVKYVYVKQVDGTTKRKAVYGKSPADLTEKVARYVEKKPDEKKPDECKTLGQWCDIWIKDYVKAGRLKPSTCKFYQSLIRYLTAELRNKKLSALKPLDFERHFNDLREHGGKNGKGLSEKTLKSYRIMLISCLERALDNDIIGVNVVRVMNSYATNMT